ncbi:hypothetical protein HK405_009779, partial [Cladochytrium tenue]
MADIEVKPAAVDAAVTVAPDAPKKPANYAAMWQLYLILALVFVNSANNGYDGSMFSSVLAFQDFLDFFGTSGADARTSELAILINVGNIVGGFLAGPICDFRGRRFGLAVGCIIIIIAAVIQGTATGDSQLMGGRFMIGVGLPITVSAAPIFVAELSPPEIRGTLVGLYNCMWYLGSFAARVTVLGLASYSGSIKWRLPLFLQMTPSVIVLLTLWALPESPRYLMFKGREEDAARVLAKYHAGGDVDSPLVREQIAEIQASIEEE